MRYIWRCYNETIVAFVVYVSVCCCFIVLSFVVHRKLITVFLREEVKRRTRKMASPSSRNASVVGRTCSFKTGSPVVVFFLYFLVFIWNLKAYEAKRKMDADVCRDLITDAHVSRKQEPSFIPRFLSSRFKTIYIPRRKKKKKKKRIVLVFVYSVIKKHHRA